MRLVHLSRCKDAILEDGCIYGARSQRRGLRSSLDMVTALALYNGGEPCCPHFGDPVELPLPSALLWCDQWYMCWLSTQSANRVYTVYLVPGNHPDFHWAMVRQHWLRRSRSRHSTCIKAGVDPGCN
jgi:hypothetical protein